MKRLKYTVIKSESKYNDYCEVLENILESNAESKEFADEIELLTLLIEKWDAEHSVMAEKNPIEVLHFLTHFAAKPA
jgi:HTH-type transcriptional regulator/antitoxin HigA